MTDKPDGVRLGTLHITHHLDDTGHLHADVSDFDEQAADDLGCFPFLSMIVLCIILVVLL